jgi:Gpi18-like mannosyltransferase
VAVFLGYLSWAYSRVCFGIRKLEQCDKTLFLNVYSYVQKEYWNVGLFTYYDKSNIVFILIGLPSLIFSLIFIVKPKNIAQTSLQLSFWILLIVTITMTNLQSSTRFLCSHPVFYINCVSFFTTELNAKGKQKWKEILEKVFDMWRLGYFYMGIVLFAMEFPWT